MAAERYAKKNNSIHSAKHDEEGHLEQSETIHNSSIEEINSDEEYTLFDPKFKISSNDKCFDIDIKNIGLFNYSDDEMKLQSEWSDTLNMIIWELSRLPCAWCFNKQSNVANEKTVLGTCRSIECKANLFAYTENNKSKLKIVIKNFNPKAVHIEKRAIRGANKQTIIALLNLNKASFVHSQLSNATLETFDYDPAHLPNKKTLWKVKQRDNDTNYRDSDSFRALCILKTENVFFRCITDIGIDPFYCIFVTPEQKEWLRLVTRFKRCIISVDSTGIYKHFFIIIMILLL